MNEDRELLESLSALADDGPRQAPAYIEESLKIAFRRRNRQRRFRTWAPGSGMIAAAAVAMLVLWMHHGSQKAADVAVSDEQQEAAFYPLPEAEALPPLENAVVVRVQLPVSSLESMGVPVAGEQPDGSVQADLLLGQDGLARGVRLVE